MASCLDKKRKKERNISEFSFVLFSLNCEITQIKVWEVRSDQKRLKSSQIKIIYIALYKTQLKTNLFVKEFKQRHNLY